MVNLDWVNSFHLTVFRSILFISLQSYEAAFQTIKEATGIEDIDLLVAKFIEVEDKNFALFNYVNELNNEIELLQEQINEVNEIYSTCLVQFI